MQRTPGGSCWSWLTVAAIAVLVLPAPAPAQDEPGTEVPIDAADVEGESESEPDGSGGAEPEAPEDLPDAGVGSSADGGVDAGVDAGSSDPAPGTARWCWTPAVPAHAARITCLHGDDGGEASPASTLVPAYLLWFVDLLLIGLVSYLVVWVARLFQRFHEAIGRESEDPKRSQDAQLKRAFQIVLFIPAVLMVLIHFYGITSFVLGFTYIGDVARPTLVVACMMACGVALGALFGLPQRLVIAKESDGQVAPPSGEVIAFGSRLERIADWLTSAIVGVTLTQAHWFFENLPNIAKFFAHASGMRSDLNLGVLLAGASLFGGLMFGYLGVQLFMPLWLGAGMKSLRKLLGDKRPGDGGQTGAGAPNAPSEEEQR